MLAKSIGEDLQKIPSAFAAHLVIIKPQEGISTRLAFGELDRNPPKIHPDTNAMVAALAQGGLSAVCGALCNVFEEGAFRALPAIAQIKLHLQAAGALGALMSGSGSAVYGVFASPLLAQKAIARLRPCLDRVSFYLCQTASHGIYRQNDS